MKWKLWVVYSVAQDKYVVTWRNYTSRDVSFEKSFRVQMRNKLRDWIRFCFGQQLQCRLWTCCQTLSQGLGRGWVGPRFARQAWHFLSETRCFLATMRHAIFTPGHPHVTDVHLLVLSSVLVENIGKPVWTLPIIPIEVCSATFAEDPLNPFESICHSCWFHLGTMSAIVGYVLPFEKRSTFPVAFRDRSNTCQTFGSSRSELDTKSCPGPRAAHSCVLAALLLALADI